MNEYCQNIGLPWGEYQKRAISEKVINIGAGIIAYKNKTHYRIAICVSSLAEAICNQHQTIASVSTPLQGGYGVEGVSFL